MNAKDVIKQNLDMSSQVTTAYLEGLSDADLMIRPVESMNHIAWQLGHLISSERSMVSGIGHALPELPEGFEASHSGEASTSDDASKFAGKDAYIALMKKMREATLTALETTPESDLDQPGPKGMEKIAPTVGAVFAMVGLHEMMHAGQYVAVRRQLGKPIAI